MWSAKLYRVRSHHLTLPFLTSPCLFFPYLLLRYLTLSNLHFYYLTVPFLISPCMHACVPLLLVDLYGLGLNRYSVRLLGSAEYQVLGNTRYSVVKSMPKPSIKKDFLNSISFP